MTTQDIKKSIDVVSKLPKDDNFRFAFTGGEPMLNNDIIELLEYAKNKVQKVELLSNGILLTKEKLEEIKDLVQSIQVSIDYPVPEYHDFRRGVSGAWKKAIDCLQWAQLLGIESTITMTVSKSNFGFLGDMLKLSKVLGAELRILRQIPYSKPDFIYALTPRQTQYLCKFIHKHKLVGSIPMTSLCNGLNQTCDAGINRLAIKSNGDVTPCDFILKTFGNILKEPIETIMQRMYQWREYMLNGSKDACKGCGNWEHCLGGCQAVLESYKSFKDAGCWV